jgi:hypothetical protein
MSARGLGKAVSGTGVLYTIHTSGQFRVQGSFEADREGLRRVGGSFDVGIVRSKESTITPKLREKGADPVMKEEGSVIIYCSVDLEMIPIFEAYSRDEGTRHQSSKLHADLQALFPEWELSVEVQVAEEYKELVQRLVSSGPEGLSKAEEVVREEFSKADEPIPKAQRYDLRTTSGELYIIFFEFDFNPLEFREMVLGSPKKVLAATKGWEEAARVASVEYMGHVDEDELEAYSHLEQL